MIAVAGCGEGFSSVDSGTADLPALFCACEPQMLRPGLTGVHSREFPGQWRKYESLRGFASNRLTVEEVMNCLEGQVMDHDVCPQVLTVPNVRGLWAQG